MTKLCRLALTALPAFALIAPMLPADTAPMSERTDALGSWVESFLGGLGLGGVGDVPALSDEAREAMEDLAEIARLEREEAEDEALEAALIEVQEYLRVVVQLLYAELSGEGFDEGAPEDATLH